jgi:RND family efflux transporter MFP subunit
MSVANEKILFQIPYRNFRILSTVCALFALLSLSFTTYYFLKIRPYIWISAAKIQAPSAVISCDQAGRILEMGPQEGERVQRGDSLFALDHELFLAKRTHLKQIVDTLMQQVEAEKGLIRKATDDYITARTEMELGISSHELLQKHALEMRQAQAKAEKIQSSLTNAQAELAAIDLQTQKMAFKAPIDGVVISRLKNPGAAVSVGEPVYTLIDPDHLWVEAKLSENYLSHVTVGTIATIEVSAFPGQKWPGKVTWIGPAVVDHAIPIKVSFEKPVTTLKPGLTATVGLKIR